jgi:outer membrane biosynthesis protein TonB
MRRVFPLLIAATMLATGCAKARAQVEPEMPAMAPLPPPPRVVAVYEPEPEPIPATEPEPTEEATQAPRPRPNRPTPNRPDTRPEPPRAEPAPRPSSPPALTLKPPSGSEAKTEASIRNLIDRAARDLGRVNYAALDADGRAQYDTARGFRQQAEEALKNRNYVFAGKLADKAATMAAVLVR